MSRSRTTFVSAVAVAALLVGAAVGSHFDLSPSLKAIERPASNTAPISGNLTATTFRDIAEAQTAMVVTIWTEQSRAQLTRNDSFGGEEFFRRGEEFFGGEEFFRRFFGRPPPGFDRDRPGESNEDRQERESTPLAATGTGFVIDDDGLIGDVPRDDYRVLGLDAPGGIIVSTVAPEGPADEAGIEPGDVIVAYAGDPVEDSLDLQRRVVGTRPGTDVAVEVVRNGEPVTLDVTIGELDLEAEGRSVVAAAVEEETSEGFGITLQDLTPQTMRRLGVPDDTVGAVVAGVASGSTAEAGGLQSDDVILSVNRTDVASAAEVGAALDAIEAGRTAFVLVQRRDARVFLQLQKDQ